MPSAPAQATTSLRIGMPGLGIDALLLGHAESGQVRADRGGDGRCRARASGRRSARRPRDRRGPGSDASSMAMLGTRATRRSSRASSASSSRDRRRARRARRAPPAAARVAEHRARCATSARRRPCRTGSAASDARTASRPRSSSGRANARVERRRSARDRAPRRRPAALRAACCDARARRLRDRQPIAPDREREARRFGAPSARVALLHQELERRAARCQAPAFAATRASRSRTGSVPSSASCSPTSTSERLSWIVQLVFVRCRPRRRRSSDVAGRERPRAPRACASCSAASAKRCSVR